MAKKKPDYTEAQQLRDKGYTIKAISEMTGLCRHGIGENTTKTVKASFEQKKRIDYKAIQKMRDYGMTVQQISMATGASRSSIFSNTRAPLVKPDKYVPPVKLAIDQSDMEKGNAKLRKGERIFKTRNHDPKKQRFVYIQQLNMTVGVKITDTRTDDEIRDFFLRKQLSEDNSLKKNRMNENYRKGFRK